MLGGGTGIRTLETIASLRAFQARALGHYAIPPHDYLPAGRHAALAATVCRPAD